MAVKRMSSIISILIIIIIGGLIFVGSMSYADAMVDPSASEENAKAEAAAGENSDSGDSADGQDSSSSKKKKKSSKNSEDVVEENAFSTSGNADLGDVVKSSGKKDFYTIRTENDNTYYLVIDHAGEMDNVYMLAPIDEEDLKDFTGSADSGDSVILPEKNETEKSESADSDSKVETPKKEEKSNLPQIITIALVAGACVVGVVMFRRYRRRDYEPEEDYSENMEADGLPTVNEDDEEFLE